MLSFFPRGVLDEILNLIESVSEDFPSYSSITSDWLSSERYNMLQFFDVVVLFHLMAIADKIYGNHCAPWSVKTLIKYAFP